MEKIKKIVRHLRSKSEEERKQILYVFMICVFTVMFFLWVWSLNHNLNNSETKRKIKEDLKPFSTLKSSLIEGYDNFKTPINQ